MKKPVKKRMINKSKRTAAEWEIPPAFRLGDTPIPYTPKPIASSFRELADRETLALVTELGRQRMTATQAHEIDTCDQHAEGAAHAYASMLDAIAYERAASRADVSDATRKGIDAGIGMQQRTQAAAEERARRSNTP